MSGQFWTGLGIGFLLGSVLFDQLWRHLNRLRDRLEGLETASSTLNEDSNNVG